MEYSFIVTAKENGQRAVDVLCRSHGFSRLQAKRIRLYGELLVNGSPHRMIDPLCVGDQVFLRYVAAGELPTGTLVPSLPNVPILYQDEWLLVVAKPAGLLTHPSFSGETDSLTTRLSPFTLHPVTRLDRDTSGLLVLAKSAHIHYRLTRPAALRKEYVAFCLGALDGNCGRWLWPIQRKPGSLIEREVCDEGKVSVTCYEVLENYGSAAEKLRLTLLTGRTHQIRVHSQAAGHALLGDTLYPPKQEDLDRLAGRLSPNVLDRVLLLGRQLGRQALHADILSFVHPITQKTLSFSLPLPVEMAVLETGLRGLPAGGLHERQ